MEYGGGSRGRAWSTEEEVEAGYGVRSLMQSFLHYPLHNYIAS